MLPTLPKCTVKCQLRCTGTVKGELERVAPPAASFPAPVPICNASVCSQLWLCCGHVWCNLLVHVVVLGLVTWWHTACMLSRNCTVDLILDLRKAAWSCQCKDTVMLAFSVLAPQPFWQGNLNTFARGATRK